jgi:hypothetical protein
LIDQQAYRPLLERQECEHALRGQRQLQHNTIAATLEAAQEPKTHGTNPVRYCRRTYSILRLRDACAPPAFRSFSSTTPLAEVLSSAGCQGRSKSGPLAPVENWTTLSGWPISVRPGRERRVVRRSAALGERSTEAVMLPRQGSGTRRRSSSRRPSTPNRSVTGQGLAKLIRVEWIRF